MWSKIYKSVSVRTCAILTVSYTENAVHHFPCFISINSNHESLTGGIPTCVQRYNINSSEWRHLQYAWMFHELDSGGISALLPSLAFPPFPGCSDHLMGTEPKNWKYDIKKTNTNHIVTVSSVLIDTIEGQK